MATGIHVQVEVEGVDTCPVVSVSEDLEVDSVVTDRQPTARGSRVVGEVTVTDAAEASPGADLGEHVFSDGSQSVYRFSNERGDCPCDCVPGHDCPVRDVRAESGTLLVAFVVPGVETLRAIVSDLQSVCDSVRVRRLTRSSVDDQPTLMFVNRAAFTDRQYEVLRTAHEMGYFARPRETDSAAVARELGISVPTFSEHLAVTQEKLLEQILLK